MQRIPANSYPTPEVDRHVAIAVCAGGSSATAQIAIAPCFFQVNAAGADGLVEMQVTPAGRFLPRDGRKLPVDAWYIDAALAALVIERFAANKTPPVIDYEHQTLKAEENGQPAPAAGRVRELVWREGVGLFARVELTARASQYIADREYLYFSPVFSYDKHGNVLALLMGALTNNPALDGMAPIELRAAARFSLTSEEEETIPMNKLMLAICAALALGADTTEDQAIAALAALKDKPDPLAALRAQLQLDANAGSDQLVAACTALQAKAAGTGDLTPDPSKFVPVGVVEELKTQVAALSATSNARAIDDLVKPALEDGRLLAAQEPWARELGKANIASLTAYLKDAQPIAALSSTQTGGRAPSGDKDANGLTTDELAICSATGVDPKDFAAAKTA